MSNLVWTKSFDTIIFRFPGVFEFGKWESSDNFAPETKSRGDSQFFEWDDSVKTEIYSGKTLRPANLSNEYNRMLFLIFRFPQMSGKQVKKNKMDNSQNGYSSVEKTGKIKKIIINILKHENTWYAHISFPCDPAATRGAFWI